MGDRVDHGEGSGDDAVGAGGALDAGRGWVEVLESWGQVAGGGDGGEGQEVVVGGE